MQVAAAGSKVRFDLALKIGRKKKESIEKLPRLVRAEK